MGEQGQTGEIAEVATAYMMWEIPNAFNMPRSPKVTFTPEAEMMANKQQE